MLAFTAEPRSLKWASLSTRNQNLKEEGHPTSTRMFLRNTIEASIVTLEAFSGSLSFQFEGIFIS